MELVNRTSLLVERAVHLDATGAERFAFVAKATFAVGASGALRPADEPVPIGLIDTFYGEPGASSLRRECEIGPPKPATDVILVGHAEPPGRSETVTRVRFAVGAASQTATVFGPRRWTGWGTRAPSSPEPLGRVPLRWERAFGGVDDTPIDPAQRVWEALNPLGVGLVAERTRKDLEAEALPQIEDPANLLTAPGQRTRPVGFGFVPRHFLPRASYAGTCDAAWQRDRMPLLPTDFDPRYHQAAPPGLVSRRLRGGETLRAEGVTLRGGAAAIAVTLPRPRVAVTVTTTERTAVVDLAIDTVLFDADAMLLTLLLKGDLGVHGELDDVELTRFDGEVSA